MDFLPKDVILEIRADTLIAVRQEIKMDKPGEMKEAVRILEDWVHQQIHFKKKDFPKMYLETAIVVSKGSMGRAKILLDRMCTMKTLSQHIFEPYDIKEEYKPLRGKVYKLVLPKQTDDHHRIIVIKPYANIYTKVTMNNLYRYCYFVADYLRMHDYHRGLVMIYDLSETDIMDIITNVNLLDFKQWFQIMTQSYGLRIRKVHAISNSKLLYSLISLIKPLIKNKIVDRIMVHKSIDELHEFYHKDIMPKDYGGNEKSLLEIQDHWLDVLSSNEHMEHMQSMSKASTDESLRRKDVFNENYAEVPGTFRALTID